jgi:uncharacterized protein (DUF2267 family)
MQYLEFLDRVAARSGLPRDRAEVATQLVLTVLAESIDEKEARDLASELARQLKPWLANVPRHGQRYLAHEFVHQVAEREGVPQDEARLHVRAVLSTVREAASRGELADVLAELFHDAEYAELWAEPSAEPPPELVVERDVRLGREEFLSRVQRRAGLDRDTAELAVRATLTTLAERITRGEADDVAAQLPAEFRPWLVHTRPEAERFSTRELLQRIAKRMGNRGSQDAERAARAVLVILREAVSEKELQDLFRQLPEDMRRLFSPAGGMSVTRSGS